MRHQFPADKKPKFRYFFVLNRAPTTDSELLVATATTRIAERRARRPGNVLVDISPSDYADLEEPSLIDCSSIEPWKKEDLLARLARREIQPLSSLPAAIMNQVVQAVACCSTLAPYKKRMILDSE